MRGFRPGSTLLQRGREWLNNVQLMVRRAPPEGTTLGPWMRDGQQVATMNRAGIEVPPHFRDPPPKDWCPVRPRRFPLFGNFCVSQYETTKPVLKRGLR